MNGCFGGCLGRLVAVVFLLILIIAAWRFGPGLVEEVGFGSADVADVSPEVGAAALERFLDLISGREPSASFSASELESLLRFHASGALPPGVTDPTVGIRDGEVRLGVRIALELLPNVPELESVRPLLPDSVPVEVRGALVSLEGGRAALIVRRVDVASVPIPRSLHGALVSALDPGRPEGLPEESITFPLPEGVRTAEVRGNQLVLQGTGSSAANARGRDTAFLEDAWPAS